MAIVLWLIGLAATVSGWLGLALSAFFGLWFGWNFKGFLLRPHRHGDLHWGVVAAIFYATPPLVLGTAGLLLLLVGHML